MRVHRTVSERRLDKPVPYWWSVLAVSVVAVLVVALTPGAGQAVPPLTIAQVQARLDLLTSEAETAQEAANTAIVQADAALKKLGPARAALQRAQAEVRQAQLLVGQLAAAAYRNGGVDRTLQLLVAENPEQFVAQVSAMESVDRHQSEVLRVSAARHQRLIQAQLVVQQQVDQLNALKARALTHEMEVNAKANEMSGLLASMQESERRILLARQAETRRLAATASRIATARALAASKASRSLPTHRGPGTGGSIPRASGVGAKAAAFALAQVGDAYVWGASGPNAFDCSGLTMKAYEYAGVSLPHSSIAQFGSGRRIAAGSLQPGDLVFYYSPIHHVGIYIGGGMIVHAANPDAGVKIDPLYSMPFSGAVRPY